MRHRAKLRQISYANRPDLVFALGIAVLIALGSLARLVGVLPLR